MIVKLWRPNVEMNKVMVEKVPIWIKLIGLDLKYWGQTILTKIAGLVGKSVNADTATSMKEMLMYARVLVKVQLNQTYPDIIMFESKTGQVIKQQIMYEWKPIMHDHYKILGHDTQYCRK